MCLQTQTEIRTDAIHKTLTLLADSVYTLTPPSMHTTAAAAQIRVSLPGMSWPRGRHTLKHRQFL